MALTLQHTFHRSRCQVINARPGPNSLLLGANLGAGFFGYLLHAVLGRLLGPASYGTVVSLIALSSVLLFPAQVIMTVVAKDAAVLENMGVVGHIHDRVRRLTSILLPSGIILTSIVFLIDAPIARFLHITTTSPVFMLGAMMAVSLAAPINLGIFQGRQQYGTFAAFLVIPVALRVALSCELVLAGFGVNGAMLGITISVFVSYLLSFIPLRNLLLIPRTSSGSLRPLVSSGGTTLLTLGSIAVLYNLDTLLAQHLMMGTSAGLYAALATVGKIILVPSTSIIVAAFPRFVVAHARGIPSVRVTVDVIITVAALALCAALPLMFAPSLVIRFVVGPAFLTVVPILGWYGLAMILFALAHVFVYYFLAVGSRLPALAVLTSCVVQVGTFVVHHHTIGDLVQDVIISKVFLLLVLGILFVQSRYQSLNLSRDI